ncbi:hypothetical protein SO694_00039245 [Aureococcus anophagefferens]|uniref:BAG domain-containing protein n=1 Tax=Aureococcus anophagefferens TaxID=44056 RepID=A0ABR1FLK7_AURAN
MLGSFLPPQRSSSGDAKKVDVVLPRSRGGMPSPEKENAPPEAKDAGLAPTLDMHLKVSEPDDLDESELAAMEAKLHRRGEAKVDANDDDALADELAALEAQVKSRAASAAAPAEGKETSLEADLALEESKLEARQQEVLRRAVADAGGAAPCRWLGGSFVSYGAAPAPERAPAPEDDDDDEEDDDDEPPESSRSSEASEEVGPEARRQAIRELAKHLQSLASTVEQEHAKRARAPKVRAPAMMLKLEDEVETLKKSRERSGDALSLLRQGGGLGDPRGAGAAHGAILEAAIMIAQSDVAVIEEADVVRALRRDVDKHVRALKKALRRADGTHDRRGARDARDAYVPPEEPKRGGGFSEIRKPRPRPRPVYRGPGHNERDRQYEDVVVVRRQDGLAVKRPHYLKPAAAPKKAPGRVCRGAPQVSRHCHGYVPNDDDLASLAL